MKVFITGDRQFSPIYPQQVMVEVLRALGKGHTIATGTLNGGVEQLTRDLLAMADVIPQIVEHSVVEETGKPDFAKYTEAVAALEDLGEVVVIHTDAHDSRVTAAFLAAFGDKVRLVTPADLLQ